MSLQTALKLFQLKIVPYGLENVWAHLTYQNLTDLEKIKSTYLKRALGLSKYTPSRIFPGKAESVMLLCFECTINPQNLIKIVGAIFEKIKIFNFFLM